MASGILGKGTVLSSATTEFGKYVSLANVGSISGPSTSGETIDTTHHKSPAGTRETIGGLIDPGELTLSVNYDPGADVASFTDTSCDVTDTSTTVGMDSTVELVKGMAVSGTGIPAGAYVASIDSGGAFTLSAAANDDATNTTLTFRANVHNYFENGTDRFWQMQFPGVTGFTDPTCDLDNSLVIAMDDVDATDKVLVQGMSVSGAGIPSGAYIASVDSSANTFTLAAGYTSTSGADNVTLTFKSDRCRFPGVVTGSEMTVSYDTAIQMALTIKITGAIDWPGGA